MLKRRVPRVLVSGFLLALAVSGLSACRTSPNVAAYVGDEQVTVAELDAAVDAAAGGRGHRGLRQGQGGRVHPPGALPAGAGGGLRRRRRALRRPGRRRRRAGTDRRAARRGQPRRRLQPARPAGHQPRGRLRERPPAAAPPEDRRRGGQGRRPDRRGAAGPLRRGRARAWRRSRFGYITVPDQATATAVLAAADRRPVQLPGAWPRSTPAPYTLPGAARAARRTSVPGALAAGHRRGRAQHRLHHPRPGGRRRGRRPSSAGTVYPTFEEVRPDLEKEAADEADRRRGRRSSTTSARTSA